jgi:hypothetical protein
MVSNGCIIIIIIIIIIIFSSLYCCFYSHHHDLPQNVTPVSRDLPFERLQVARWQIPTLHLVIGEQSPSKSAVSIKG